MTETLISTDTEIAGLTSVPETDLAPIEVTDFEVVRGGVENCLKFGAEGRRVERGGVVLYYCREPGCGLIDDPNTGKVRGKCKIGL